MPKSAWHGTDDVKPKPLPETNGCFIRRDNKIELHRAKAKSLRLAQTILAHLSAYSKSARARRNHEGGLRNERTGCGLIRLSDVSPENAPIVFSNVSMRIGSNPISQHIFTRN